MCLFDFRFKTSVNSNGCHLKRTLDCLFRFRFLPMDVPSLVDRKRKTDASVRHKVWSTKRQNAVSLGTATQSETYESCQEMSDTLVWSMWRNTRKTQIHEWNEHDVRVSGSRSKRSKTGVNLYFCSY